MNSTAVEVDEPINQTHHESAAHARFRAAMPSRGGRRSEQIRGDPNRNNETLRELIHDATQCVNAKSLGRRVGVVRLSTTITRCSTKGAVSAILTAFPGKR